MGLLLSIMKITPTHKFLLLGAAAIAVVGINWAIEHHLANQKGQIQQSMLAGDRIDTGLFQSARSITFRTGVGPDTTSQRELWVFANPNCSHCKDLHRTLMETPDTTVHVLLLHNERSSELERKILCAAEPEKALKAVFSDETHTTALNSTCDTNLIVNDKLASTLGVAGTPTSFNRLGQRIEGSIKGQLLIDFIEARAN